jgi:hypothetical protein
MGRDRTIQSQLPILSPGGRLMDFVPTAPGRRAIAGPVMRSALHITYGNHLWSVPVKAAGWSMR